MLVFSIQLFLYFQLIDGDNKERFDEGVLMEHHHKNKQEVNSFIDTFHPKTNSDQEVTDELHLRTIEDKEDTPNDEFLDYEMTKVWWNDSNQGEHEITPQLSFLTTPFGHGMFPMESTAYERLSPPSERTIPVELQDIYTAETRPTEESTNLPNVFITRPSFPISTATPTETDLTTTLEIKFTGTPIHPQYPYLTPPKGFPPDFKYPTVDPLPPDEELVPNKTLLTPKYPLFTLPDIHERPSPPFFLFPNYDTMTTQYEGTTLEEETVTDTTVKMTYTTLLPKISDLIEEYVKEHGVETVGGLIGRTNPGVRLLRTRSQQPPILADAQLTHTSLLPTTNWTEKRPATSYTGLGNLIFGNITVSTTPLPTTIPYQYILAHLREGYMMAALIELMALLTLKPPAHVHEVVTKTYYVVKTMLDTKPMQFLGFPLTTVVTDLAKYASTRATHIIQHHARLMYGLLLLRRQELSAEVNAIIDNANSFYGPYDGRKLLDSVRDFGIYPNSNNDAYTVCDKLIERFFAPYFRIHGARQMLANSINRVIRARFLQYQRRPAPIAVSPNSDKSKTRTPPQEHNTYQRHRKSNLKPTTQSNNSNRRQYRPTETEFPMLRSLKPITLETTLQRRYHIVTSKYHFRQMNIQPTTRHYVNLITRRTKSMNDVKGRYISKAYATNDARLVSKVNYERRMNNDGDKDPIEEVKAIEDVKDKGLFYHQMKERFKELNEAKSGKLKAEMLRKIVDGSSYSDEEANLKMKVVEALLLGTRSVESDKRQ